MILILDAHALLWWLRDEPSLDRVARASVADPANEVAVSAATAAYLPSPAPRPFGLAHPRAPRPR